MTGVMACKTLTIPLSTSVLSKGTSSLLQLWMAGGLGECQSHVMGGSVNLM